MNAIQKKETVTPTKNNACHAFCPICGVDLYYLGKECICKNKECSWTCSDCHNPLEFA